MLRPIFQRMEELYMVKKLLISFLFLNFLLVIICINKCYATVPITDENLKNVFNEFISSSSNDNNYRISLESEIIKIDQMMEHIY